MGRVHIYPALALRIDPAAGDASTGERQRVLVIMTEHRQFEIAIKWRGRNRLPHGMDGSMQHVPKH